MMKKTLLLGALLGFASGAFASGSKSACGSTDLDLTVVNNTTEYALYVNKGPKLAKGSQHFCMPNQTTWTLGLDDAIHPTAWSTYGYGWGGIAYSIDARDATHINFTVKLGPASQKPSSPAPVVTINGAGYQIPPQTDSWTSGLSMGDGVRGNAGAPITVTFSDQR